MERYESSAADTNFSVLCLRSIFMARENQRWERDVDSFICWFAEKYISPIFFLFFVLALQGHHS
jgi:hypothetical protein